MPATASAQAGHAAADCPPAPIRVTKSLLGYGVIAGPGYVAASLAEALTRSGFSLTRDDWSLLADGALGWIHMLVLVLAAGGFPAGTPPGPTITPSWHGALHIVFGGVGFLGLIAACLVLAWQFRGLRQLSWAVFSLVTAVVFLAAFAGIATGGATSSTGVLAFTGAVILAWAWLALVSARLYRRASMVTA